MNKNTPVNNFFSFEKKKKTEQETEKFFYLHCGVNTETPKWFNRIKVLSLWPFVIMRWKTTKIVFPRMGLRKGDKTLRPGTSKGQANITQ